MDAFAALVIYLCWFIFAVTVVVEFMPKKLAEKLHKFFSGRDSYEPYERD